VLGPGEARLLDQQRLAPSLSPQSDTQHLIVNTDSMVTAARVPVCVEVLAPGGAVVADQRVPRGDLAKLDATKWPAGPYEAALHLRLPDGREKIAYVPWYKGDARVAAQAVVAKAQTVDRTQPFGATYAMLADMIVDRLGGPPASATPAQLATVYDQFMEVAELENAQQGGPGGVHGHGMVRLAYIDDIDGSPQWCRAYLPTHYTPEKKWPMVVVLHGYNPPNPPYVKWWSVADRHDRFADDYGVIVLQPMGRYNTTYLGLGDRDILRVIELAKQRFAVDDDRVYLMGYSMGGAGTWNVGTRHPDLFAALAPYYGGWDYRVFLPEQMLSGMGRLDRMRWERDSSFASAEQLLNLPIWVTHGDADLTVDVAQSRYGVRLLQRWGYDVRYREVPGGGHAELGGYDELFPWMLSHTRQTNPTHVRLRSADLTYAGAYWLRVSQQDNPFAFITAEASAVGPNDLQVDTANALEIVLTPGAALADPAKPLHVTWNGEEYTASLQEGRAVLRATGYVPRGRVKTAAIEGPLSDLETTPFAIVQGTISPDLLMRRLCELQAQNAVRAWETWQHATPRFFKDTEANDADLSRYSLVLLGGPEDNAVTKRLQGQLPLQVTSAAITIDGRAFPVTDGWVRMIYPHPLNPDRYVTVLAATSPAGMYLAGAMPDLGPAMDFVIGDSRRPDAGQGRSEEKVLPAAGQFGRNWELDPRALVVGDPAIRAKCPVRKAPTLLTAQAEGNRLWLSEVLETAAESQFSRMMRDLNWLGRPITLGGTRYARGLAANTGEMPNGVSYDLGGVWKRLRGVIGIEVRREATPQDKDMTRVTFVVSGDGKELYRSPGFTPTSRPVPLDVDITGVRTLRLEVATPSPMDAVASVDWADLRLER
jgi:predicted esterase